MLLSLLTLKSYKINTSLNSASTRKSRQSLQGAEVLLVLCHKPDIDTVIAEMLALKVNK